MPMTLRTTLLALTLGAITLPAQAHGHDEPQLVQEEHATYLLFAPVNPIPPLYPPCDGIGGACFTITGTETMLRITLQDDLSPTACADLHISNPNHTQVYVTGGCDVLTVSLPDVPLTGLTWVYVYMEVADLPLDPQAPSIATRGTITLQAYT